MGEQSIDARRARLWFWGLFAMAVALRVFAFNPYSAHHPDETIQYLEQAHRIVFGYGVVPWEFRYFIRSWLIPLLLVPSMQLGEWIDPGGTLYLILPRAMLAAFNLAPVWAAWVIGRRQSLQHAIVAMAVIALWVECVLFSVQVLSESLAVSCFLVAAALLHSKARMPAIVAAGALMALAGLMRFQFGPAIAVYAVLIAGKDLRLWKGLIAGGIPVVLGGAAIDLAMGLFPYQWVLTNFRMNILEGRMREIGGVSHWHYAQAIMIYWKAALLPIAFFVALAWREHKALIIAALVNIAVHQLIGHKEYRYLWLSIEILLLVAAMGSVNLLRETIAGRRLAEPGGLGATAVLIALWGAGSLALATTETYRLGWRASGDPGRLGAAALRDPRVCGLAVPRQEYTLFGYALLHRNKPVFLLGQEAEGALDDPGKAAKGFNAAMTWVSDAPPPPPFVRVGCRGGVRDRICLYRRSGGCEIDQDNRKLLFQETLLRLDM
ncbi:MAG: hypothetical protein H0W65_01680 [Sphingomonas sp.]|uniref:hypothetical protein n=1 Tax=Sphingomonas sp. TaxID=28214 RepID=UPI00180C1966|nr:hypothetical protein [Sphingomonas sp.]MBA3666419.1 hypothetical protein [Sphingomonas sp.]